MIRFLLALASMVAVLTAQSKFEVASVKQNTSPDLRTGAGVKFTTGGRVFLHNLPLYFYITMAYDLPFQSSRLTGGPDWSRSERYDIDGITPEGVLSLGKTPRERSAAIRVMLQDLLRDRFQLVMQRETKEMPIYAVIVGKKGVKLDQAGMEEKDCAFDDQTGKKKCNDFRGGQGRGIHAEAASIEDVASFVSNWSDRPVVDQTDIKTLFKFDTPGWVPMRVMPGSGQSTSPEGLDDPLRPSLFSIFEQMGLKLEARKAPLETFRIESIQRLRE